MDTYLRKLYLLILLLIVYLGVSFWVPYSKKWLLDDIIHNQARMFFTAQSQKALRAKIIDKAETLGIPLELEQVTVQNINGEIIYIELDLNIPFNILSYHSTLHFEPKIFGLIRGFNITGGRLADNTAIEQNMTSLSDSTKEYLRNKTLRNYFEEFYAH
ncbi:MAG: hypothetical protein HOC20_00250 [Chloroflexi bacterium]|jgi:hypothetical protein|nr:hypothetical protein [Chloroflexota bacterium]